MSYTRYTDEMIQWMRDNIPGNSRVEKWKEFCSIFGNVTQSSFENTLYKKNIKSGIKGGQFLKGHKSWNKGIHYTAPGSEKGWFKKGHSMNVLPIGSESIMKDGYTYIKVQDTGTRWEMWQPKSQVIWNENYPDNKVEKYEKIVFLDLDKQNCVIENLFKVNKGVMAIVNRMFKLTPGDAEGNRTLLQLAIVKWLLGNQKKKHGMQTSGERFWDEHYGRKSYDSWVQSLKKGVEK